MAGTIVADTLTHSSAGSVSTQFVVEGSAKMWINLDGDAVTPAALDSLNVGSITDGGSGVYSYNFSSNMTNINYCFQGTACQIPSGTASGLGHEPQDNNASYATGSVTAETYYHDSSTNRTNADLSNSNAAVFGELA